MTRFSKIMLRYRFFTVLLLLNIGLSFIAPEIGKKTLLLSLDNLLEMLSIIPPVFILLGLMDVWIPKEIMMKYMGKGAGIKGGVFAFADTGFVRPKEQGAASDYSSALSSFHM